MISGTFQSVRKKIIFTVKCIHFASYLCLNSDSIAFAFTQANEPRHDKTNKMSVRPAKTQISLGSVRPVWSESSLCTQWVAKDPNFLHADSEDSDQTGRMSRLIWVFAGRTCHFVGFVMLRLILRIVCLKILLLLNKKLKAYNFKIGSKKVPRE